MKENSKLNYSSYDDRFVSKLDRDNLLRASAIINALFVFFVSQIFFHSREANVIPLSTFERHLAILFSISGCLSIASLASEDARFLATVTLSSATATSG